MTISRTSADWRSLPMHNTTGPAIAYRDGWSLYFVEESGMDIEIPDHEDAACALDKLETIFASRGDYDIAGFMSDASRRIRADAEEIARLQKAIVWSVRHGVFLDAEIPDESPVLGYWHDHGFRGEPELDLHDDDDDKVIATACRLAGGE